MMIFPFILTLYRSYLNKIVTPYSLRKHALPLPDIAHTFAGSSPRLPISKNEE